MTGPKAVLEQLKRLLNYHKRTLSAAEFLAVLSPFISKEMDLRREKTWLRDRKNDPRRLYYFSAEYLTGRLLRQNLISLDLLEEVKALAAEHGLNLTEILEQEYDPGLGNGGLGRLASCFMDSLVNMDLPATGYGICYRYGLFRQKIEDHRQVEYTDNWRDGDLWGTEDKSSCYTIPYGGSVNITVDDAGELRFRLQPDSEVWAIPVDYPVAAVNSSRVHPLRLWRGRISHRIPTRPIQQRRAYLRLQRDQRGRIPDSRPLSRRQRGRGETAAPETAVLLCVSLPAGYPEQLQRIPRQRLALSSR